MALPRCSGLGLGQDHLPAGHRRAGARRRRLCGPGRRGLAGRIARPVRAATPTGARRGVPGGEPVRASVGPPQPGVRPAPCAGRTATLLAPEVTELLGIAPCSNAARRASRAASASVPPNRPCAARGPRILLMDEPLAALDLKRKREILPYLERLHRELSIPVIYVSHAPDEVARLADHLVLLDAGRAIASGALNSVLSRIDLPAAFADDAGVVLDTVIDGHETDHLSRLRFAGGQIWVSQRPEPVGTPLRCRIHARNVSLALIPSTRPRSSTASRPPSSTSLRPPPPGSCWCASTAPANRCSRASPNVPQGGWRSVRASRCGRRSSRSRCSTEALGGRATRCGGAFRLCSTERSP